MNDALLGFLLLAPEGEKHAALELAVLIMLPLVLSFVLLWFANKMIAKRAHEWLRWVSLVPLLAGIRLGFDPFSDARTERYWRYNVVSDNSEILHYAAFIVPCVATLGMIAYLLYLAHSERMER